MNLELTAQAENLRDPSVCLATLKFYTHISKCLYYVSDGYPNSCPHDYGAVTFTTKLRHQHLILSPGHIIFSSISFKFMFDLSQFQEQ